MKNIKNVASAAVAACLFFVFTAAAMGKRDQPFADREIRDAAVGCWNVGADATLKLRHYGKHSLWATTSFAVKPRLGPQVMSQLASWVFNSDFEVACRPRSQHGSFCLVRPETKGGLRVRVFARSYRSQKVGKLVEDFVARPCRVAKQR